MQSVQICSNGKDQKGRKKFYLSVKLRKPYPTAETEEKQIKVLNVFAWENADLKNLKSVLETQPEVVIALADLYLARPDWKKGILATEAKIMFTA